MTRQIRGKAYLGTCSQFYSKSQRIQLYFFTNIAAEMKKMEKMPVDKLQNPY